MSSEYTAGWEAAQEDFRDERKTQYGVQIIWIDPVAAGGTTKENLADYTPKWMHFDTEEQADEFAQYYLQQKKAGDYTGVADVNRATRWAIEEYGEWEV